jgi:hypothetical protein
VWTLEEPGRKMTQKNQGMTSCYMSFCNDSKESIRGMTGSKMCIYCRCGFAQGQSAYNSAVESLFETLDMLDQHLSTSRYLCGDSLTLADIRLFTTLFRFDPVYQILFKCTKQKLAEYHSLDGYMRDIYQVCCYHHLFVFLCLRGWKGARLTRSKEKLGLPRAWRQKNITELCWRPFTVARNC